MSGYFEKGKWVEGSPRNIEINLIGVPADKAPEEIARQISEQMRSHVEKRTHPEKEKPVSKEYVSPANIDAQAIIQFHKEAVGYYQDLVIRFLQMPFRTRLKFLIFPRQVIKEL